MRIIVFSDSHGRYLKLKQVVDAHPDADYYIHLGDGCGDVERLQKAYPQLPLLSVPGNCDSVHTPVSSKTVKLQDRTVLYTHGHPYGVKYMLEPLALEAQEKGADLVLFGHTHIPTHCFVDGVEMVNPGSVAAFDGIHFAILDFEDGNLITNLAVLGPQR